MDNIEEKEKQDPNLEIKIAIDTLERYSGSLVSEFQPFVLLTNFSQYLNYFALSRDLQIYEGSSFRVAHSKKEEISMIDFKIGSPSAALVADLCAFLPIHAALLLGMCGGLRAHYAVGDYFIPVASIRGEGTSDFYFPPEVPALANFVVQKAATNVLDDEETNYHIGITHSTNIRFWEFNADFRHHLETTRPQAIEMECATLFIASYKHKLPLGALLLISDLPLQSVGIKTKKSASEVLNKYTKDHVEKGVKILENLKNSLKGHVKGIFRTKKKHFTDSQTDL